MKQNIEPYWISAKDMRDLFGIKPSTEFVFRKRFNLHISKMGKKTLYDRNQINQIITNHSTYALLKTA